MHKHRPHDIFTNRLRLRRVRGDDLNAMHAVLSDPLAMRFWSSPAHSTLAETKAWFASMLAAEKAQESDEFVVEHLGVVIGKMGVWRPPEIGFFLHRDCWGRGLATEALKRYICYARERAFKELTADVDPRNATCLGVLAKCGFVEIGRQAATYFVNGQPCDSVYLHLDLKINSTGGIV